MTDPRHDDGLPRDPDFDRMWASVSAEAPPPALDAAVQAAARREVGAGPRATGAAGAEATRPERWWFPLAAAATIGAVALGLLQVVGRDGVFGDGAPAVVSDLPADTAGTSGVPPAPGAPPAQLPRAGTTAPAPLPDRPATRAAAPKPAMPADTMRAAPRLEIPAGAPAGKAEAPTVEAGAASTGEIAREASASATLGAVRDGPPVAPRLLPAPAPAAPAAPGAPERAAEAATADAAGAAASSSPVSRERTAAPASAAKLAAPLPERARADAARPAGAPLPVPDWIALIRRLRDDGRVDEAVKELVAFRRAHADHLQLLPPDLAAWRPEAR